MSLGLIEYYLIKLFLKNLLLHFEMQILYIRVCIYTYSYIMETKYLIDDIKGDGHHPDFCHRRRPFALRVLFWNARGVNSYPHYIFTGQYTCTYHLLQSS